MTMGGILTPGFVLEDEEDFTTVSHFLAGGPDFCVDLVKLRFSDLEQFECVGTHFLLEFVLILKNNSKQNCKVK